MRIQGALALLITASLGIVPAAEARPPAAVSNASLLLEQGVFRALPDVPGAAVTTHLRNAVLPPAGD